MAEKKISIRDLYPGYSDQEYEEAEARLRRYVEILAEIYESRLREGNETEEE
jgi:hypothetical protein